MNDPFARLGVAMGRLRWYVVGFWVVVLVLFGGLFAPQAAQVLVAGGYILPGSESDQAETILDEQFNASTANNIVILFESDELTVQSPEYAGQVSQALEQVAEVEGVEALVSFFNSGDPSLVSDDGHATVAIATLEGEEAELQDRVPDVRERLESVTLDHYVTGTPAINYDLEHVSERDLRRSELYTIPIILVLLLLVFRTIIAAAVPLILGGCAVVLALAVLAVLGEQTDTSIFAMNVASMIGLGLGIDFSLIVVSRFRDELRAGRSVDDAIGITMATAGRSITYSGVTVILGMLVLTALFGLMIVRSISLGVLIVATCALALGLTLLPAVLVILGHKLEWLRIIPEGRQRAVSASGGTWYRISHAIMRRPWLWLGATLVILLVAALPALRLDLYGPTSRIMPASEESARGVERLNASFGANTLTPVQVVIQTPDDGGVWRPEFLLALKELSDTIADDPRVAATFSLAELTPDLTDEQFAALEPAFFAGDPERAVAASRFVNLQGDNDTAIITVVSEFDQYDDEHESFVRDLRSQTIPDIRQLRVYDVYVGGDSARYLDFEAFLYDRFPYLVLGVMALTFVILMMFFQSVFLPFKAILMNVASILATYGILIVIFQYGWGASLLGFEELGRLGVFTPPVLFAILFGLSTDYEVFMLSRVKEYYHETGDNEEAVASGLEHTAGIITAAGLILIGTFGSFGIADILTIKEIGIGLAIGVLIDATIVRVIMVPATMRLMGNLNWWMPAWLKRIVPELSEGPSTRPLPAPSPTPAFAMADGGLRGGAFDASHAAPATGGTQGAAPAVPTAAPTRIVSELHSIGASIGADVVALPRQRPFRIGRDETSDLQLFDVRVSRLHAQIVPVGDNYFVADAGSTNGVFINGQRVTESTWLRDGDVIEIANMGTVIFRFAQRPESSPAPGN